MKLILVYNTFLTFKVFFILINSELFCFRLFCEPHPEKIMFVYKHEFDFEFQKRETVE